ncbi:MAG TPA: hypothetical protein VFH73_03675 [Polyangia bacterium]|jgi:hypothetical protein|nr:hypothetical protein [Polyangia bacterium]
MNPLPLAGKGLGEGKPCESHRTRAPNSFGLSVAHTSNGYEVAAEDGNVNVTEQLGVLEVLALGVAGER